MKLIKPSFEIIEQGDSLEDIYKHIEFCGRTCYKSEDKITEDSAKPFVDKMIASKHYAMLEHGTVYLQSLNCWGNFSKYKSNKYSTYVSKYDHKDVCQDDVDYYCWEYITTNLRVLVENGWLDDLQYICKPTEFHKKRYTVKFTCNRQVSHEFVRHRVFSFAQESTRFCNYTKGKFGGELSFIEPCWYDEQDSYTKNEFDKHLRDIESLYQFFIDKGWRAQQAATILPNAIKTELVMTGFEEDWKHFFDLRALGTTGVPHPQAKELAFPLMEEFTKRGYI